MVIFTPFCRTEIGKDTEGIEVSHRRKSLCMLSCNSSTSFSNSGIQLTAKWQFCSKTQPPFCELSMTKLYAFLP